MIATPLGPAASDGPLGSLASRGGTFGAGLASGAPADLLDRQRSFAAALGNEDQRPDWGGPDDASPAAGGESREAMLGRLERQFERLVAQTLVQPLLKQARESNTAPPPWGPTPAEKQMGGLLDEKVALDITRKADFPIVQRLARQMLDRRLGTQPSEAAPPEDAAMKQKTAATPTTPAAPTPAQLAAMPPAERAAGVEQALREVEAAQAPLLEAVRQQREATKAADPERLGAAIARTEAASGDVRNAEQRLAAWLVAPNLRERLSHPSAGPRTLRVSDVAAALPPDRRDPLLAAAGRTRAAAEQTAAEVRVVRAATESLLAHARGLQKAVAQRLSHAGTYSRAGNVDPGRQSVVSSLDVSR